MRDFSLTPFDDVANKDFFELMENDRTYKTLLYRVKHAQVIMDNAKDELAVARSDLQRERRHPMIHGPKKEILAKMSRQLDVRYFIGGFTESED